MKKTMAKIVRELEAAGHKVTNLSKQGVKSIGFVGGVPAAEVQVQEKRAGERGFWNQWGLECNRLIASPIRRIGSHLAKTGAPSRDQVEHSRHPNPV